jgi:hypothetical protein
MMSRLPQFGLSLSWLWLAANAAGLPEEFGRTV